MSAVVHARADFPVEPIWRLVIARLAACGVRAVTDRAADRCCPRDSLAVLAAARGCSRQCRPVTPADPLACLLSLAARPESLGLLELGVRAMVGRRRYDFTPHVC